MGKHQVSSGETFLVDDCFDEMVDECSWQFLKPVSPGATSYVRGKCNLTKKTVLLHRVLMGANPGEEVDHVNFDGMDNRLSNLRIVTPAQNRKWRRARHDSETKLRGIDRAPNQKTEAWRARVNIDGRRVLLGTFATKEDAIKAYNCKAKEVHGEFAYLNEEI